MLFANDQEFILDILVDGVHHLCIVVLDNDAVFGSDLFRKVFLDIGGLAAPKRFFQRLVQRFLELGHPSTHRCSHCVRALVRVVSLFSLSLSSLNVR